MSTETKGITINRVEVYGTCMLGISVSNGYAKSFSQLEDRDWCFSQYVAAKTLVAENGDAVIKTSYKDDDPWPIQEAMETLIQAVAQWTSDHD